MDNIRSFRSFISYGWDCVELTVLEGKELIGGFLSVFAIGMNTETYNRIRRMSINATEINVYTCLPKLSFVIPYLTPK
jgi:hypothetical protein